MASHKALIVHAAAASIMAEPPPLAAAGTVALDDEATVRQLAAR